MPAERIAQLVQSQVGQREIFSQRAIGDEIAAHRNRLFFDLRDSALEQLPVVDQYQRLARQIVQQAGGRRVQIGDQEFRDFLFLKILGGLGSLAHIRAPA